jgi:hypothetical protein
MFRQAENQLLLCQGIYFLEMKADFLLFHNVEIKYKVKPDLTIRPNHIR